MVYTLAPKQKEFDLAKHFRPPKKGKVAVFFSGGMESTLVGDIYLEMFDRQDVLFFYSDSIYCDDNPVKKYIIHRNVDNGAALLDINPIYVDVPYSTFAQSKTQYYDDVTEFLVRKYDVEFMVYGFTKLLFDLEPIKRLVPRIPENIRKLCFSDSKFDDLIEQLHLYSDDYMSILTIDNADPVLYDAMKQDRQDMNFFSTPLETLNKPEVVDLYRQRNKLEMLAKTFSCMNKTRKNIDVHCGACFNCQQRHDAYDIAGVEDPTSYSSTLVKERRKKQRAFYDKVF